MRRAAIVALALAAACNNTTSGYVADLRGPVAVAAYRGLYPMAPERGIVPLIAVATSRGNDLRLIDPTVDQPIMGPNFSVALSVPTLPRPLHLASTPLHDLGTDALVVASGGTLVQLVGTWLDNTGGTGFGVVQTLNLAPYVSAGSVLISLTAGQRPTGPTEGSPPVAPVAVGSAVVFAGFTGGDDGLGGTVVEIVLQRQGDGSIALAGAPVTHRLGFDPIAMSLAPDNTHLYVATTDPMLDASSGSVVYGVAEIDTWSGSATAWQVRALDGLAPTTAVASAFVGERTSNFYTFAAPALRVYAAVDPAGCGPQKPIACGIATFDPARGGLAADPAPPAPASVGVPTQPYRTPLYVPALPIAMAIGMPPVVPAPEPPGYAYGSQVCVSPAVGGGIYPTCPSVDDLGIPQPFNAAGVSQPFMVFAPATGQRWSSGSMMVLASDGSAYIQDLGHYGPPDEVSLFNDDTYRVRVSTANTVGPAGPVGNSAYFGFPPNTAAIGVWADHATTVKVVYSATDIPPAMIVWPGFTTDDHWLVAYQSTLPGLAQRRAVLGLLPDGSLFLALQDALGSSTDGTRPVASPWLTEAFVNDASLGIHDEQTWGLPADIAQFLLDADPCPSTRPNWIPAGSTTPVYDPTEPPLAHEAPVLSKLPVDPVAFPGGALRLGLPTDPAMASEYTCLVQALSAIPGRVLTAFRNNPSSDQLLAGAWIRAGAFLLKGERTGYAGRPQLDVRYNLAWQDESGLSGEALVLARKARRFYYPGVYGACPRDTTCYPFYPEMVDPMSPGPVLGFRLGRYCATGFTPADCDANTSPPARDAGVDFFTVSGVRPMVRRPSYTSAGSAVTSFDKSVLYEQEFLGRVFYATFVGDALFMVPPGLDFGQTRIIR